MRNFVVKMLEQFVSWESWIIVYKSLNDSKKLSRNNILFLPPKDRFWADPFIINRGEIKYL